MLIPTKEILISARSGNYAVGAFNIYNLEGATAVIRAAEEMKSPVMLQLLPVAIHIGKSPLVAMCCEMGRRATVPVSVHLDHCSDLEIHRFAIECGVSSVMADGAGLEFEDNIRFTSSIVDLAAGRGCGVEGELGKLSGEEDGLNVDEKQARLTSPDEVAEFVHRTSVDALAVCIGNVHGRYSRPPQLDFDRLSAIAERVSVPLVLHGASGIPEDLVTEAIRRGVCKFNVNTEVRSAYLEEMRSCFAGEGKIELVDLMRRAIEAMQEQVRQKMVLFCSADKAA